MDTANYLEALAARARLAGVPLAGANSARFAAGVWGKVDALARRAGRAPDATPLFYLMGGAAAAAAVMLAWSASVWNALALEAATAPSFVQDLFTSSGL